MLFNIVFALQAQASHSIVKCYYDLSKRFIILYYIICYNNIIYVIYRKKNNFIICLRLGIALRHEEKRCGFLTEEIKIMVSTHDEVATRYI